MIEPVSQAEFATRLGLSQRHGRKAIGKRMQELRRAAGISSQNRAAEILGVYHMTYKRWEQGTSAPCCGFMRLAILQLLGL